MTSVTNGLWVMDAANSFETAVSLSLPWVHLVPSSLLSCRKNSVAASMNREGICGLLG